MSEHDLPIEIDLRSSTPAYIQIMMQVECLILRGMLKPGEQLPTVRQLALQLAVNFNTVARAYRLLDRVGLISTQQGRGTFLLESSAARHRLRKEVLQELTEQYLGEIERLDFEPDEVMQAFRKQFNDWIEDFEQDEAKKD